MEKIEHTPGPWVAHDDDDGGYVDAAVDSSATVKIADTFNLGNAHLIAAAPEMLALLEATRITLKNRDQDEREANLLLAIRHVISKAQPIG